MKMIKENKWKIAIASILTLAPIVFYLCAWDFLTKQIGGVAEGGASVLTGMIIATAVLLLIFGACILVTALDKRSQEQSPKMLSVVFYIIPAISLYANALSTALLLGVDINMLRITTVFFGLLFVVMGNYMPKCKQSFTLGIKIKWTLANEANWNATHRLTGRVWVICGGAVLVSALLPTVVNIAVTLLAFVVAILLPFIYSYAYYKKQLSDGTWSESVSKTSVPKSYSIVSAILVVAVLTAAAILMFSGSVSISYSDESFTVDSTYGKAITVNYSDVEAVEYREDGTDSARILGFSSARLLVGSFDSDELGPHTRYSYTGGACVVVRLSDGVLVLGGESDEETLKIYDTLLEKTEK